MKSLKDLKSTLAKSPIFQFPKGGQPYMIQMEALSNYYLSFFFQQPIPQVHTKFVWNYQTKSIPGTPIIGACNRTYFPLERGERQQQFLVTCFSLLSNGQEVENKRVSLLIFSSQTVYTFWKEYFYFYFSKLVLLSICVHIRSPHSPVDPISLN